jgi:hypothetical protein
MIFCMKFKIYKRDFRLKTKRQFMNEMILYTFPAFGLPDFTDFRTFRLLP